MVRFETLSASEKLYPYVKAVAAADYKNGTFGTVTDGVFTAGATGFQVIMQVERGDDIHSDEFVVKKDEPVRVADLSKAIGQIVNITADELPSDLKVGDKAASKADGTLEVPTSAPTKDYLLITEITTYGAKAQIVE